MVLPSRHVMWNRRQSYDTPFRSSLIKQDQASRHLLGLARQQAIRTKPKRSGERNHVLGKLLIIVIVPKHNMARTLVGVPSMMCKKSPSSS